MGKSLTSSIPLPDLIARYAQGEQLQELAAEANVHRITLYRWMLSGLGDEQHHNVVTDCLVHRIADADHALLNAPDICNVTRAREMAKFARMDLERRRPHLYGMRTGLSIDNQIHVTVHREKKRKAPPVDVKPLGPDLGISDITPT